MICLRPKNIELHLDVAAGTFFGGLGLFMYVLFNERIKNVIRINAIFIYKLAKGCETELYS